MQTRSYQRLHHLLYGPAHPVEAGPVGAAGGAISPGQAAVLGGALRCPILLTPQLAANITV